MLLRSEDGPSAAGFAHYHERGIERPSRKSRSAGGMAEALWREYKATGDVGLRNRLVLTYVAAGQAHRLQEDSRAAALVRGRRPDLVRHRDTHRRDRPLGPGEGRGPGAVPLDAHSRSGPRRAAAPRLGAALAAPRRARPAEGAGDVHRRARAAADARGAGEHDEHDARGAGGEGVRDPQLGPHLAVVAGRDRRRVRHRADRDARVGRPARRPGAAARARGGTRRSSAGRSSGSRRASARWRCSCTCRT